MEAGGEVRARRQHPEAHLLPYPRGERPLSVLEGDAIEGGVAGLLRLGLGRVHLCRRLWAAARTIGQVDLGGHRDIFAIHLRESLLRLNDDCPMHAGGDMGGGGRGAAVVQPHASAARGETVDEALAGRDGAHRPIGGEVARVEIDGVADGAVVDQSHLEHVPHFASQGGADRSTVEGPAFLPHPRRHLQGGFRDAHLHPVDGLAGGGRGHGIHDGVQRSRVGLSGRVVMPTGAAALRCGGILPGDTEGEYHAGLPVSDDGAPALQRLPNHAEIQFRGLTRGEPRCGGIAELEVVNHRGVVVPQLDDDPVTPVHISRGRLEPLSLPGRDLDSLGPARRIHPRRGRGSAAQADRGGIDTNPHRDRQGQGQHPREQAIGREG